MDSRNKTWRLIQKWRDEYNSTPNGWAVAYLIGAEYEHQSSRVSTAKRIKLRRK